MPPHHRARSGGRALAHVDAARLDTGLRSLVPDDHDRAFVLRCLLDEGPVHHRGANYALVALLLELLSALGAEAAPAVDGSPVPMRLPPHLGGQDDAVYPLALDLGALRRIAADPGPLVGALTDGPPQHAVANVVMVDLLAAALRAAERR